MSLGYGCHQSPKGSDVLTERERSSLSVPKMTRGRRPRVVVGDDGVPKIARIMGTLLGNGVTMVELQPEGLQ